MKPYNCSVANKTHLTAVPLRSIAASELGRNTHFQSVIHVPVMDIL